MVSQKALQELLVELKEEHLFSLEEIQSALQTSAIIGAELIARTRVAKMILERVEETQGLILDPDPEPQPPSPRRKSADEAFEDLR